MTEPGGQFAAPDDTQILHVVRQLYDAFAARDNEALLTVLTADFRCLVAEGMPAGLGGTYHGAQSMLRDCWARIFALADVCAVPTEYLPASADRVVVLGRYQGTARSTGRALSAAFAHIIRVTDGRVSELVQITDTARWHHALAP